MTASWAPARTGTGTSSADQPSPRLALHPDCLSVSDRAAEPARLAGQPLTLDDLTGYQREVVGLRVAHLMEAETGFRGGDPLRPGPGEPLASI
jgi:hypothetical protein